MPIFLSVKWAGRTESLRKFKRSGWASKLHEAGASLKCGTQWWPQSGKAGVGDDGTHRTESSGSPRPQAPYLFLPAGLSS